MATTFDLDGPRQRSSPDEQSSSASVHQSIASDERYVVQLMPRPGEAYELVAAIERVSVNPKVEIHGVRGRTTVAALAKKLRKRWREQGVVMDEPVLDLYAAGERVPFAENVRVRAASTRPSACHVHDYAAVTPSFEQPASAPWLVDECMHRSPHRAPRRW